MTCMLHLVSCDIELIFVSAVSRFLFFDFLAVFRTVAILLLLCVCQAALLPCAGLCFLLNCRALDCICFDHVPVAALCSASAISLFNLNWFCVQHIK